MSEKYPKDEYGRYIGKYPHQYPDHLNYLKASREVRKNSGYASVRKKKVKQRTRPDVKMYKLMLSLEQVPLIHRVWYNVELFVPDFHGWTGEWTEGAPMWISAVVATRTQEGWKYGCISMVGRANMHRTTRRAGYETLRKEIEQRGMPFLLLHSAMDTMSIRMEVTAWIRKWK